MQLRILTLEAELLAEMLLAVVEAGFIPKKLYLAQEYQLP